jgi:hypothetical protein
MAEDRKRKPSKPKPPPKMTKAEQSERFKETAREIGMSEGREDFERAFRKIVPPKNYLKSKKGSVQSDRTRRDSTG